MRCTSDTEVGMTSFEGSRRKDISWRFHLGYFLKEERKSRERELTRVEQAQWGNDLEGKRRAFTHPVRLIK